MATETVYTTGKSSTNARINIGSGALSSEDGQIAFPDECSSIKLVGAGSHPDGQGTLLIIDSSGVIKKAGGAKTTIATVGSDPATPTARGIVYGFTSNTMSNVSLGLNSGSADDTDSSNTVIGYYAGFAINTGLGAIKNTLVGTGAGSGVSSGNRNTLVGAGATISNGTGINRIALGDSASSSVDGQFAISDAITQIKTVGLGSNADDTGTILTIDSSGIIRKIGGTKVTMADWTALATPTTKGTIYGQTVSEGNAFYGWNSAPNLIADATSNDNTAIGREALFTVFAGTNANTAVGAFALYDLTTGNGNTSIGRNSAIGLTTGSNNTFIGQGSDTAVPGCVQSIALGTSSNITADYQLAISDAVTHIKCTSLGTAADGEGTLLSIDSNGMIRRTGGSKTTITTLTAAATPTALGMVYGYDAAQAAGNVMYGFNAGPTMNSTTQRCTGMGSNALKSGGQTTTWSDSAFGYNALGNYTSGNWNNAFGSSAGATLTDGNGNVFIGTGADTNAASSTNRIAIGYLAVAKANNEFAIAPSVTQIRAEGLSNITPAGYSKMMYDATNKIMRPMSGCDMWIARLETEYAQAFSTGTGTVFVKNLTPLYGSTASWLSGGGTTVTIPSGFPNLGLWEVTTQVYVTQTSSLTALSLDVLRGATTFSRYATGVSTGEWLSYGGSCIMQLTPGQTIQMRLTWGVSGATSVTIKADAATYIYLKFLGVGTL
ncbi:Hypothetical protein PACV_16 [Pacmanvirus A23]|uniref:tail spike protein n=1 Tax=Pacmanvirus A23 TaxID=1932881 RepID=UPI000A094C4A|nr:tail spike protein [Pacmanvirus A23]SIP85733.1 Hypothetical protein PACV_16 [Pacmanvirus A23]